MTSRKTLVDQAITFQNPARIPLWFVNADQTAGDAMVYHLSLDREDGSGDNEWGYHLEKLDDGTMGHPTSPHLPDWQAAEHFTRPPVREAGMAVGAPRANLVDEAWTQLDDQHLGAVAGVGQDVAGRVDHAAVAGELGGPAAAGLAGGRQVAAVLDGARDGGDLPDPQAFLPNAAGTISRRAPDRASARATSGKAIS